MTMKCYEAGVWEQQRGFVSWSRHRSREAAAAAARRYARRQNQATGGGLSWAGGYREVNGEVTWMDKEGQAIR